MTGGCQCGAVRYRISGEQAELYVCHCRECQKQSASAFGISVVVSAGAFQIVEGTVGQWSRRTDSGRILHCVFCAGCGSRIYHATPNGKTVSVKGGSLDLPLDLTAAVHIWTARKLPGVVIPDRAPQFSGEPG